MEKRKIEDMIDKLNIPVDILGYKYLITALEIYIKDIGIKVTAIYEQTAKKHNATCSSVERAIRHAIESNEEKIKQYFNVDYKITNRRFLALFLREMRR